MSTTPHLDALTRALLAHADVQAAHDQLHQAASQAAVEAVSARLPESAGQPGEDQTGGGSP